VKLNDIFGAINPFQQKATVPNGMINVTSPFADFGGLLAGRTLYPELNQRKFVLDYENNSEVYAIINCIYCSILRLQGKGQEVT
jgi:hypothetical protein